MRQRRRKKLGFAPASMEDDDGLGPKVPLNSFGGWASSRPAEPDPEVPQPQSEAEQTEPPVETAGGAASRSSSAGAAPAGAARAAAVQQCQAAARAAAAMAQPSGRAVPEVIWAPGRAPPGDAISDEFRVLLDYVGLRGPVVATILQTLELCEVNRLDVWLGLDDMEMNEVRAELRAAGVSVGVRYTLRTELTAARVREWRGSGGDGAAVGLPMAPPSTRPAKAARTATVAPAAAIQSSMGSAGEPHRRKTPLPATSAPQGEAPPKVAPWNIGAGNPVPTALGAARLVSPQPQLVEAKAVAKAGGPRSAALSLPEVPAPPVAKVGLLAKVVAAAKGNSADCRRCRGAHCRHTCGKQKVDTVFMTTLSSAATAAAATPSAGAAGARESEKSATQPTTGSVRRFSVGDRVQGQYTNGFWYDATVKRVHTGASKDEKAAEGA